MNTTLQAEQEQPMNTTILNYPGYQALPKGVKQMLLVSEAHFFDQPAPRPWKRRSAALAMRTNRGLQDFLSRPWIPVNLSLRVPA